MGDSTIYSFIVEWYRDDAGQAEQYKLNFYPQDNSVEMHHLKHHRLFLKRIKQPELKVLDFFIGSTINVLSRHLCIVNFADDFTAKALAGNSERCVCIISHSGACNAGKYIASFEENGFKLVNLRIMYLSNMDVRSYFADFCECKHLDKLTSILADGGLVALELMRRDANSIMRQMVYGTTADITDIFVNKDLFMPTYTPQSSAKLAHVLFSTPTNLLSRKVLEIKDCTCAVIKPHAVQSGLVGNIWKSIQSHGFCVVAAQVFRLSKVDAGEFLDVYKGVLTEYPELISEYISGPCVALLVTQRYDDPEVARLPQDAGSVQHRFREIAGPMDPEIARFLMPNTIRAQYGVNQVKNALHCTDIPEDVPSEVEFFFRILSG